MRLYETKTASGTPYRVSFDVVQSGSLVLSGRVELGAHVFVRTRLRHEPVRWEVYSRSKRGAETFLGYAPQQTVFLLEERLSLGRKHFGFGVDRHDSLDHARAR